MAIRKLSNVVVPYVDNPNIDGQNHITWIVNGEPMSASNHRYRAEGAMNKTSWQLHQNIRTINHGVNEIVEYLNDTLGDVQIVLGVVDEIEEYIDIVVGKVTEVEEKVDDLQQQQIQNVTDIEGLFASRDEMIGNGNIIIEALDAQDTTLTSYKLLIDENTDKIDIINETLEIYPLNAIDTRISTLEEYDHDAPIIIVSERISDVDSRVNALSESVNVVNEDVNSNGLKIDVLDENQTELYGRISTLESKGYDESIDDISAKVATQGEIINLIDDRVDAIEKNNHDVLIEELTNKTKTYDTTLETLTTNTNANTSDISKLKLDVIEVSDKTNDLSIKTVDILETIGVMDNTFLDLDVKVEETKEVVQLHTNRLDVMDIAIYNATSGFEVVSDEISNEIKPKLDENDESIQTITNQSKTISENLDTLTDDVNTIKTVDIAKINTDVADTNEILNGMLLTLSNIQETIDDMAIRLETIESNQPIE